MDQPARSDMSVLSRASGLLRSPLAEHFRLSDEAESYQKPLATRYVFPAMTGMSILYYLAYWSPDPSKVAVLGIGVFVTLINIFLSTKNRILRIGDFEIHSRSDLVDCARWIVNLTVFDVMLAVVFDPSMAGFALAWLILVISAQADTFKRRHRHIVVGVGLLTGAVLLGLLFPTLRALEYLLIMFCMTAVVFVLGISESYWTKELNAKIEAQGYEAEARREADLMKQDALTGHHLRTVSHEMNNLLSILDMASDQSHSQVGVTELAIIRRAVTYAKKINALVLGDFRSTNASRVYAVQDLIQDVDLLLSKEVRTRGIAWQVVIDPVAALAAFHERGGSTYFIMHNLVKNAWEAFDSRDMTRLDARRSEVPPGRLIRVVASIEGRDVVLSIEDNAGGISETVRSAILEGRAETSKKSGHGLGLRFVLDECRKNNFRLSIDSDGKVGSTFRMRVPILGV